MPDSLATFHCDYALKCSGCGWHNRGYEEQAAQKVEAFVQMWREADLPPLTFRPKFLSIAQKALRDRVDLIIDNRSGIQKIGMFDYEHKEIIDLKTCEQLSPNLQKWLSEFRQIQWPIQRGSVRLRVSPQGQRGVWLDFANADVKALLDESHILENLLTQAVVEIGQRRKILVKEDRLRLKDPVLKPWFETYVGEKLNSTPLLCNVGGFTQPGFRTNRALINEVMQITHQLPIRRLAEFGSGIGNFTLPLAAKFDHVTAYEIDALACSALRENLKNSSLNHKVEIHQGDLADQFDAVFVDPPRSGLKGFLDPISTKNTNLNYFIYVSCYPESFCADAKRLYELGFTIQTVTIVDQFPQTPHAELVAYFKR